MTQRQIQPDGFDLSNLAEITAGFSGAEIEQVIISALYRANNIDQPLAMEHLKDQIRHTKPLSVIKAEEIAALRAWSHERTRPA